MNIELRPLSDIKPYERNPRHNDDAVEAVARSIREFGFRQPIVVDGDGVIVVGHTRWKAAQSLGLERVPVHVATELTPEQAKAYRQAENWPCSRIRNSVAGSPVRRGNRFPDIERSNSIRT